MCDCVRVQGLGAANYGQMGGARDVSVVTRGCGQCPSAKTGHSPTTLFTLTSLPVSLTLHTDNFLCTSLSLHLTLSHTHIPQTQACPFEKNEQSILLSLLLHPPLHQWERDHLVEEKGEHPL